MLARQRRMLTAAALAVLAASGCGGGAARPNEDRPPVPITVTASVSPDRVSVSPRRFGAGPVSLVVANLTDTAQRVTLETAGAAAGIRTRSGPIDPRDTAELRADLRTGRYTVRVTGGGIRAATLRVAGRRPSAQNDLLQP